MPPKKKAKTEREEFESKHDYIPGFLEALGELADIYEDQDDFRKTALRRAIIALDGQIITAVEDIKLFKLIELFGVGKSTLEMLEEFIETGKIKRLIDLKATPDQVEWFASLTKDQADHIQYRHGGTKKVNENGRLHNNEVCIVFAKHTRVVVFFVEVNEHENMSILLVTHDVIIDFDELFWTHLTRHLRSYWIQFIFVLGSP
jgi:hypothetical protein